MPVLAIRKPQLLNGRFDRHVAGSKIPTGKWMPPHEQKVENQYREAEVVVIWGSHDAADGPVLQLRRRKGWYRNFTQVELATDLDLKAVAVNQLHGRSTRDPHTTVIDVTDYASRGMDGRERAGNIARRMYQEWESGRREVRLAALRAVEIVNVVVAGNFGHQEPDRAPFIGQDEVVRPRGHLPEWPVCEAYHCPNLIRSVLRQRLVIDLGDDVRLAGHIVNRAFTPDSDLLAQADRHALAVRKAWHRLEVMSFAA
jgi:hypothetical protein